MLTAGAIAPAVEQIASPVTGICPRSENLKFYVNYVPCNLLFVKVRSTGLHSGAAEQIRANLIISCFLLGADIVSCCRVSKIVFFQIINFEN